MLRSKDDKARLTVGLLLPMCIGNTDHTIGRDEHSTVRLRSASAEAMVSSASCLSGFIESKLLQAAVGGDAGGRADRHV